MKESLAKLMALFDEGTKGSRGVAALVLVAMALAVAGVAITTKGPHYEMAFSNLGGSESAAVMKALSDESIEFRVSQPPGPYIVWVDEDDVSLALSAAYGAGALDRPLKGVRTQADGMSGVFQSAAEREQRVRYRELEEVEGMLEALDFVVSARVLTAREETSAFLIREEPERTASVTIAVRGGDTPSAKQADTVAKLVSRALAIDRSSLMISDQSGLVVFDGDDDGERPDGAQVDDWFEHKDRFDTETAAKATRVLEQILGPNKARVTVDSSWDFTRTATESRVLPKGTVVSETKTSTETPVASNGSPAANAAKDDAGFGVENMGTGDSEVTEVEPVVAKTDESRKEYETGVTTTSTITTVPRLERLSVALFLDASIDADQVANLEKAVQNAVGFDTKRDGAESFTTTALEFFAPEVDPDAVEAGEVPAEPNPMMETLLKRGVEIAVALVFLVLLLKSLKGAKKAESKGPGAEHDPPAPRVQEPEPETPAELLARRELDQLLTADPEKVGAILSGWARDDVGLVEIDS